jgi:hypothetical protein
MLIVIIPTAEASIVPWAAKTARRAKCNRAPWAAPEGFGIAPCLLKTVDYPNCLGYHGGT